MRFTLGLAMLTVTLGQPLAAQQTSTTVTTIDPADAPDHSPATEREDHGWVLVEGAISDLTAGRDDWYELAVTGLIPVGARDTLVLSAAGHERFGLTDIEVGALYTVRAGEDMWLRAGASVTPSADFRPSVGVTAGLDWRVVPGRNATIVGFDAGWRDFPLQNVWNFSPSLTQYVAGGMASITARASGIIAHDEPLRVGGLIRGDIYPADGARAFLGAASGPDTDFGIVSERTSVFGGFELPVIGGLAITGSIANDWRNGSSDKTEGRIGVKVDL